MSEKELSVTSASEWRTSALVELPSGQVARLRSVTTGLFNRMGKIPDAITAWIYAAATATNPEETLEETTEKRREVARRMNAFIDEICVLAFVEPRLVHTEEEAKEDEDSIWILNLEERDRQFVFGFYNKPLEELKSFRPEQALHVEPVQPQPEVQRKTKRTVRVASVDAGKTGVSGTVD